MLKNNKQRGTGLRLVRTADAFAACFETTKRPGLEGVMLYRWGGAGAVRVWLTGAWRCLGAARLEQKMPRRCCAALQCTICGVHC